MTNTANFSHQSHLHPLIYKILNVYNIYIFLQIDMWNVPPFTGVKAGEGRVFSTVIFDKAFTYFIELIFKWTTMVEMIQVKGLKTVWVDTASAVAVMFARGKEKGPPGYTWGMSPQHFW